MRLKGFVTVVRAELTEVKAMNGENKIAPILNRIVSFGTGAVLLYWAHILNVLLEQGLLPQTNEYAIPALHFGGVLSILYPITKNQKTKYAFWFLRNLCICFAALFCNFHLLFVLSVTTTVIQILFRDEY